MNPHATNQPDAERERDPARGGRGGGGDTDDTIAAVDDADEATQRLVALLQSTDPDGPTDVPLPPSEPDPQPGLDDAEAISQINALLESPAETDDQDAPADHPSDATAAATTATGPEPARQPVTEPDPLPDLSPDATDLPISPAPAAPPAPPVAPAPAAQAPTPIAQTKPAAAPAAAPPSAVGTQGDDPSTMDLDAEIEALLAEQAIDPEVLSAAEDLAQQDALAAEQNQEALRLRAQEAAGLLDAIDDNTQPAEDDITAEIDALLSAVDEPGDDALTASGGAAPATDAAITGPANTDPTIDQIDRLLAAEAEHDDEDELAGAFFSAQAIASGDTTAGEQPGGAGNPATAAATDAGEATPEVFPLDTADTHPAPAPGGDPAIDMDPPMPLWRRIDWARLMDLAEEATRRLCWLVNWPARRYLTAEWRATLGYLALVQVAGAAAVWLFLIIL